MLFNRTLYAVDSTISGSTSSLHTDIWNLQGNVIASDKPPALVGNANAKFLMYTITMLTRDKDPAGTVSSVTFATADPNESWFLHSTATGNPRVTAPNSGGLQYYMNVGNTAYQAACATHILERISTYGPVDGVFIDVVASNLLGGKGDFPSGQVVLEYSSPNGSAGFGTYPSTWQTAMLGWLTNVCGTLRSNGVGICIGNVDYAASWLNAPGDGTTGSTWWNDTMASGRLDGAMEESWMDGGSGPQQQASDQSGKSNKCRLAQADFCATNSKYLLAHSHRQLTNPVQTDEVAARYALGMLLLTVTHDPASSLNLNTIGLNGKTTTQTNVPWFTEYGDALSLGAPTAARVANADGTYSRTFTNGNVLANPTSGTLRGVAAFDSIITITSTAPTNQVVPVVSGNPVKLQVLTTTNGTWTNSPSFTYQWKQYNASTNVLIGNAGGAGATTSSYTVAAGDIGVKLGVTVTATNGSGAASANSSLTVTVVDTPGSAPVNTVAPAVTVMVGTALPFRTLTATTGTWTGNPTPTFSYQWQLSTDGGSTYADIATQSASTYAIQTTDAGNKLRCVVTGTNSLAVVTGNSNATTVLVSKIWLVPTT